MFVACDLSLQWRFVVAKVVVCKQFIVVSFFSIQATAEANNLAALATSKDSYSKRMDLVSSVNHGTLWAC